MTPRHLLFMIAICVVWGFTFVAGKAGVNEFPPIFFTGLRFVLLAAVLAPFLKVEKGQMANIALVSVALGSVHFALFYTGLSLSENVSIVAVAVQLGVPFATLLSVFFLGERIGIWRSLGIGLAFSGVMIIGFDPAALDDLDGLVLVLLAAFVAAIGTVVMRRMKNVGVFQLQAWVAMLSWPVLFALSAVGESGQMAALQAASWQGWGGVIYTALGASLFGHAGMFYLLQRYEVSQTAPLTLLAPVFGMIFGITVWGDALTLRIGVGALITLFGIFIIAIRKKEIVDTGP